MLLRTLSRSVIQCALLLLAAACLPLPHHVGDTPRQVRGRFTDHGSPVVGARLAIEPRKGPADTMAVCLNAPVYVRTDSTGRFSAPQHKNLKWWILFLGESEEWNRSWRLCFLPGPAAAGATWQVEFEASTNLWNAVEVDCDLGAPWVDESRSYSAGRCHASTPPYKDPSPGPQRVR